MASPETIIKNKANLLTDRSRATDNNGHSQDNHTARFHFGMHIIG